MSIASSTTSVSGRPPIAATPGGVRVAVSCLVMAGDVSDEGPSIERLGGLIGHDAAVEHHDDTIGDLEDLLEPVRDVDDGDAFLTQTPDHGEQVLDLLVGQRRGRLVEHHHPRLLGEPASNDDHALLRDAQFTDDRLRIDVDLETLHDVGGRDG